MIQIGKVIVSREVLEKKFVCDLQACKGECCVQGDSGAPLTDGETEILEKIFEELKPFLREEGIRAIEKQGTWLTDSDGDKVTPLVEGKECAYTVFNDGGIAECGIEKAWKAGAVRFRKPESCHLYPVRLTEYRDFTAMNYHRWEICSPACKLGEKLQIPVYVFLKDALIRKLGEEWYDELCAVAKQLGY